MVHIPNKPSIADHISSILNHYWRQIAILLAVIAILSLFFPRGKALLYSYQLNDVAREEVVAPFNFPILKTEGELQSDLDEAIKLESFLFFRSQDVVNNQVTGIEEYFTLVNSIQHDNKKLSDSQDLLYRNRFSTQYDSARIIFQSDSAALAILMERINDEFPFASDNEKWKNVFLSDPLDTSAIDLENLKYDIIQISRNRWAEGIYDIEISEIVSNKVAVDIGNNEAPELTDPGTFNDLQFAWTKARVEVTNIFPDEADVRRDLGYSLIIEFMKPNLIYDRETTERRQQARQDRVPRNKGIILKNERIVDANTRITTDDLQKLHSLSVAIDIKAREEKGLDVALAYLGRILVIGIIISFFFTFLLTYRTTIFEDWKMVLLLALIFTIEVGLAYLFTQKLELSEYLIPITVAAMVLTIMFDARIGFMGITSIILLVGILIGNNVEFMVTSMFTSSVGIYAVRQLRRRSQLFTAIFALVGSSALAIISQGLFKGHPLPIMGYDMMNLGVVAVLSPIVTYGLIGILEVSFSITTNLTLIELLDFQHPLLKRLQQEANGTFNHSIVVGNLAEACADAIGANSLLCRVGAYYHDLGKMARPEYFIENQYSGQNKHDSLTPVMSAKIIKNHVTEGLNLAKEYALPSIVSDFIPMHHGTTRVEYFYRKALEEAGDEKVNEKQFQYPGPKPNSKETGILMICEAVEAAVRSIKDPNIMKIEEMIDKIVNIRLTGGQLSECPLTMDELTRIKGKVDGSTGLLPVLRGIYHIRIEYPDDNNGDKPQEDPEA
ncbi:MAG: HDIG domain-containing protein [Candidatus Marinimicrobia bacterium]|nr:HDIG domain-containing protein [Candidatus Neomarinimicrobiota bacterium]MBL7011098.1 HDIG domain-containing protein [Candidatus Neomarinimicrobiota bacterium]MBL7030815.1 HDIG domain-containing protein [Candidatus Neomarinimicrobiota bacterium]